jgi:hypothetical protein
MVVHEAPEYLSGEIVPLETLPAGSYLIRVENQKGIWTKMIIKN